MEIEFEKPNWSNPLEWVFHPIACVVMLPIFLVFGLVLGIFYWGWNVKNSSSCGGSWRPMCEPSNK